MPVTSAISPQTTPVPGGAERRRSPRRPHVAEAFLSSPTGGNRTEVSSFDVSKHGVGITLKSPIAAGTFHLLQFGVGDQKIATEVRILSCQREPDGSFRAHAEFC